MLMILEISKFKGIEYALIQPKDPVTKIGGRNGQGKTSATDALVWLLSGAKAGIAEPVKVGSEKTKVMAELNGYRITRTKKTGGNDTLKVERTDDGSKMPSPQKFLDEMLGAISFDPGSFSKADPKTQKKMILDAFQPTITEGAFERRVGVRQTRPEEGESLGLLGISDISDMIKVEEELRTEAGRKKKAVKGQLDGFDKDVILYPTAKRSVEEIHERRDAEDHKRKAIEKLDAIIEMQEGTIAHDEGRIKELERQIEEYRENIRKCAANADSARTEKAKLPEPEVIDFRGAIEEISQHNAKVDQHNEWTSKKSEFAVLEIEYEERTKLIKKMRDVCLDLAATVELGVEGLDLSGDTPSIKGVPLGELSDAEKLKVGIRVAMAQNPKIRIIRIKDGNHLDRQSFEQIAEWVQQEGYQVFVELVTEEPQDDVIYMVEGRIDGQEEDDA